MNMDIQNADNDNDEDERKPKSLIEIQDEIVRIGVKSQIPKYAIEELTNLISKNMVITYAIKMQSSRVLFWILIILFTITYSFIAKGALVGALFFSLIIPYFTQKVVIFTNTAIFVFPVFNRDNYKTIPVQDITDIRLQKDSLIIDTNERKYKFSHSWGLKSIEKQRIALAINELLRDSELERH